MKKRLFALASAGVFAAMAFEKIAFVDNFDFGAFFDLETAAGEEQVMRHAMETGCDKIWWRVMSGAVPRYKSAEERAPSTVPPFDLLRLPLASPGGWTHFERMPEDLFGIFRRLSEKYGVGFGAHWTVEEAHWCDWSVGAWNLEHPQFWCRNEKMVLWPGKASLAFPEVLAHKLRLVDEIIATGVETIYIDTCRYSGWTPSREFVKPNIDRWRSLYGDAPLPLETARRDERWLKIVAENEMRYLREIRKRLDRAVPRRRLALGLEEMGRSEADGGDFMWHERALDWRRLAAEGTVDDLVVICVRIDKADPWNSVSRVYDSVVAAKGGAKIYFPVRMYDFWNTSHGIPTFMKASGLSAVECGKRLLAMAYDAGGDGIVMECVDYNNYPKELREAIRTFGKKTAVPTGWQTPARMDVARHIVLPMGVPPKKGRVDVVLYTDLEVEAHVRDGIQLNGISSIGNDAAQVADYMRIGKKTLSKYALKVIFPISALKRGDNDLIIGGGSKSTLHFCELELVPEE